MARRNRYDEYVKKKQGIAPAAAQWRAAAYLRISREDGDKEESDSIATQKEIIMSLIHISEPTRLRRL